MGVVMIRMIISGGQTGADQAALDVAIKFGIPHSGWIAKGRKNENGRLPDKYQLQEMPAASRASHAEQNLLDSDGTLIISHGKLTGGSEFVRKIAMHHERPWLHIDLSRTIAFKAARKIRLWLRSHKIEVLNVAGPRASKDSEIYKDTVEILETAFYIDFIDINMPHPVPVPYKTSVGIKKVSFPRTVDQAVTRLISDLSLRDKTKIAKLREEELVSLYFSLGEYIRNAFGLWSGNRELMESCRTLSGMTELQEDDASAFIVKEFLKRLHETYRLRVVK
jgi:hypothetical protein